MKHSEFIRKVKDLGFVEDLGFEVVDWDECLITTNENGVVGSVNKNYEAAMDTNSSVALSTEVRVKLLEILVEYAKTPIQERKEERKFSIYPIRTNELELVRYDDSFRNFGYEYRHSFGIANDGISTTVFPESEAKEICDFFGWDFDKVAVEVDDEE